mmetsp:Transcript_53730/g.136329  ORF Transcript_53730/g.136329 Transcript_53730/m.136329 type:complete len:286 (-) Transcript_53730:463-1320(-)|eukprot:CAMPEP_0183411712 /NCGR_PEP_ID=MMETSP0370-20130417/20506_1 /TAXON_ID=268820 /ORGANISM="Peridinium aciculiferum, Strain PAER-2" /LENGTH=285 /DNA_ID=CAMNT_0025594725 /DNA_START=89 /DNA_END=946 /DNA_ORIENTATION=-
MAALGQCCSGMAPTPGSMPSAAWDLTSAWYTSTMSPGTSTLAFSLLSHLGILGTAAPTEGGLRFLETHCGDALAASMVLPAPGVASYTACDFSEQMLRCAQENLGDKALFKQADSTALPFETGSFDRYMSNMGGCCVSDLDAKLREAYRVLAPGGIAAMSMRLEAGDGDSAFALINETLKPLGYPAAAQDREGLQLGKDLAALKAKLRSVGFKGEVAWRTWVVLPLHDEFAFSSFATSFPPVQKWFSGLDEATRAEATEALRAAGKAVLETGAIQVAVAAVVAKK